MLKNSNLLIAGKYCGWRCIFFQKIDEPKFKPSAICIKYNKVLNRSSSIISEFVPCEECVKDCEEATDEKA